MEIPTEVTKQQFEKYIEPHLSKAKRGFVSEQPLYKIFNCMLHQLHTGCHWENVPIEPTSDGLPAMSYQVPYYHFRKWSRDGSFQRLCDAGILSIKYELHVSELSLAGSHTVAKKRVKVSPIKEGVPSGPRRRPAISYR